MVSMLYPPTCYCSLQIRIYANEVYTPRGTSLLCRVRVRAGEVMWLGINKNMIDREILQCHCIWEFTNGCHPAPPEVPSIQKEELNSLESPWILYIDPLLIDNYGIRNGVVQLLIVGILIIETIFVNAIVDPANQFKRDGRTSS
jgi:hypothetical protein